MEEREPLERQRAIAARRLSRGLMAVVSVPIVVLMAILLNTYADSETVYLITVVNTVIYSLGAGTAGILMVKSGAASRHRAEVQLRDFDERHQLPEARVVIR